MFVLVALFMNFTKYGREIYAIGGARKEALAAGISLKRPMIIVAGLGGVIIGLRSGTAQALGLKPVACRNCCAFIGGVSILGGRGGVIGAVIGALTVNFLNTGLVFNVTPAFMVQLYLGILLLVVIMFQTGSVIFEKRQRRYQILKDIDDRREPEKRNDWWSPAITGLV